MYAVLCHGFIVDLLLNKELKSLEIETMFKPLSESEDIKQYINQVLKETKKTNRKLK